ncbi:MAG: ketoacyl-ACP synthase III [Myxococcota bacterium]
MRSRRFTQRTATARGRRAKRRATRSVKTERPGLPVSIVGTGFAAPGKVQTAEDLAPQIGRSADWIRSRTGVVERRVSDLPMEEMAALAARDALGDGPPPDLILNASLTPVQLIPDSSVFIQEALGYSGIPSFSVHATCLSFLVGLHTAVHYAAAGTWQRILLVSAEKGTGFRDFGEPESAALIGDGAAAAVIERGQGRWLDFAFESWPEGAVYAQIPGAGTRLPPHEATVEDYRFRMQGTRIYRLGRAKMAEMMFSVIQRNGLTLADIDLVVPHQMSGPGLQAFRRVGVSDEQLVDIVSTYGNCVAASLPMALATAERDGRLRRGAKVLFCGLGAGLSLAAGLMEW